MIYLAFFGLVSFAETGKQPDPNMVKKGKVSYDKYCASCHGEKGDGEIAPPIGIRGPDYFAAPGLNGSAHSWHHTDENLLKVIMDGSSRTPKMRAWRDVFDNKTAEEILAYFKNWWPKRLLECQGPKHMSCM